MLRVIPLYSQRFGRTALPKNMAKSKSVQIGKEEEKNVANVGKSEQISSASPSPAETTRGVPVIEGTRRMRVSPGWTSVAVIVGGLLVPALSRADAVTYWNEVATRDGRGGATPGVLNAVGPPAAIRFLAMMHLAMHDAVNSVDHAYDTYFDTYRDAPGGSKEAAAARVGYRILAFAVPAQQQMLANLYQAYIKVLQQNPDGDIALGAATGDAVADEMIAARTDDGSAPITYTPPPPGRGVWQPNGPAVLPQWGNVNHFFPAVGDHGHVDVPPPPRLSSRLYRTDLAEVRSLGQDTSTSRTADQTDAALFWAPNDQIWISEEARIWASSTDISLNAQRFALLMGTMEDSAIDGFYWKYQYVFWRPFQALNQPCGTPWAPLRPTPNHPEYPSAHAFIMASSVGLMEQWIGDSTPVTFYSGGGVVSQQRSFDSLNDALQELKQSRIWIGFHYRNSTDAAEDLGRTWADLVLENNYLAQH